MDHSDFLDSFIEDTREHLGNIESNLMDLEQAGAQADEDLVNTVFRAAHSIKGSAGFLALNNVRDLAHKLENILHMVRNKEIVPDKRIISALLSGFDLLSRLVEMGAKSDEEDISESLAGLNTLTEDLLPDDRKGQQDEAAAVSLPGGHMVFSPDMLTLQNALSGGKFLYLVEYDLIHDVQARGKTPLDIIRTMESSGFIVDCRVDLAPMGDLDAPLSNKLPFYVLFATIVEPDVIGYLFALDSSAIHLIDPETLLAGQKDKSATPVIRTLFGFEAVLTDTSAVFKTPDELSLDHLDNLRQALLTVLDLGLDTVLDLSRIQTADTALVQLLCSAHKSFDNAGRHLALDPSHIPALSVHLGRLGYCAATFERCIATSCPFSS